MSGSDKRPTDAALYFAGICEAAAVSRKLAKLVFAKPAASDGVYAIKTTGVPVKLRDGEVIQFTSIYNDGDAKHRNIKSDGVSGFTAEALSESFAQAILYTASGSCEYRKNKKGDAVIGGDRMSRSLASGAEKTVEAKPHDREKSYILPTSEPFMRLLGVTDGEGAVKTGMRAKFRQINRFLEYARDVEPLLPETVNVADLCCGKSYLSFAVYLYLTRAGHTVKLTGVDLKRGVIEYCGETARTLGLDTGENGGFIRFICADINDYVPDEPPDLVISLHACDTATDTVLDFAVRHEVGVILSTPCCHHELNHKINCPPLSFVTDYSMLRQKLCDAATDALRCLRLRMNGYDVDVFELVDPEDTPKNVLLRAVRRGTFDVNSREAAALRDEYEQAVKYLGIDGK